MSNPASSPSAVPRNRRNMSHIRVADALDLRSPLIEAIFFAITRISEQPQHTAALAEVGWQQINDLTEEIQSALSEESHHG